MSCGYLKLKKLMKFLTYGLFINTFIDLFFEGYLEFIINCWVNIAFPPAYDAPSGEFFSLLVSYFFALIVIAIPIFSLYLLYRGPKYLE